MRERTSSKVKWKANKGEKGGGVAHSAEVFTEVESIEGAPTGKVEPLGAGENLCECTICVLCAYVCPREASFNNTRSRFR